MFTFDFAKSIIMKKSALLIVFFLSAASYAKVIPTPFWYSISEKILTGTHLLISTDEAPSKTVKAKTKCVKAVRLPLKCQPKKEKDIILTPFFTVQNDGMWTDSE